MSQPILSIITPVLNGERYLPGVLQSVVDQRCSKIEHIIIDSASTDHSVKIIEEFAGKYSHIRWLSEKDSGPSEAINKGIALARGTFITILCLADFYEPNTLNEAVGLLPTLPQPVFLVGNCNMLDENDELLYVNKPETLTPLGIMLKREFPYNPTAYFYHKDLHEKAGLYYNCDQFDVDFLLRVFKVAKTHYVDKCWGNFRMLPDSTTVILKQAGKLDAGKKEIFERHLKTYSVIKRIFIRSILRLNMKPKTIYYLARIGHYFRDPKDILRYLRKKFGTCTCFRKD